MAGESLHNLLNKIVNKLEAMNRKLDYCETIMSEKVSLLSSATVSSSISGVTVNSSQTVINLTGNMLHIFISLSLTSNAGISTGTNLGTEIVTVTLPNLVYRSALPATQAKSHIRYFIGGPLAITSASGSDGSSSGCRLCSLYVDPATQTGSIDNYLDMVIPFKLSVVKTKPTAILITCDIPVVRTEVE